MLSQYIGNIIKYHRKSQKISQEQLAIKLNIDRHYISKIEKGKVNITINYLNKILQELNIQPTDLFNQTPTN